MKAMMIAVMLLAAVACERERRDFKVPDGDRLIAPTQLTQLRPGAPGAPPAVENPFIGNAYALSEGKRLYSAYNCAGCHAQGGGAIGPALMDHRWIYGGRPDQIFSTIVQGRPNGMPAFGERIPEQQVWQLVAYVESMSGRAPKDAAPARNDDMQTGKSEMRREPRPRIQTGHR